MSKIRVYELARDLNMKNKELLDKLSEMDIQVGTHMSSVDEETVGLIRARLLGDKTNVVEEVRVRSTVIRRRRKVVDAEPAQPEAPEEEKPEEEAPVPEAEAKEEKAPEKEAEKAVPKEASANSPFAAAKKPILRRPKKSAAAKIVAKPAPPTEEAKPVEPEKEAPPKETAPEPVIEAEKAPETAEKAAPEAPARKPEPETAASPEEAEKAPEPEEKKAQEEPEQKPEKKVVKAEPPKRPKKKETPAKIIKMGMPPKLPPRPEKAASAEKAQPSNGKAFGGGAPAAGDKRKGAARRPEEGGTRDKRFLKKKISFRRKAVVEGSDLYARGARRRKGKKGGKQKAGTGLKPQITTAKAIKRRIKVDDAIVLSDLAKRMGIKANELIGKLMGMGVMATVNQSIDYDTAVLVAGEFDYEVERAAFEEENFLKSVKDDPEKMANRPPVVTVMGHVDHGKTSLLDVIRQTRVTEGEAGGITQHIGAYYVSTENGRIVFLDTPGHEAFTAMRSRGAQVTDLVILVVAADDGVMPQTIEAVNHARAAEVPIIVAINKMDKANADPDRVQRQLADLGLTPEDWGGDTIYVKVSAKQEQGIDSLLEMVLLQSEMMELKANPEKLAIGHVIEARLDSGRGAVATLLILEGTLNAGDAVVCGLHHGKVRALRDTLGEVITVAGPSMPVEIIGLSGVPNAGDELIAVADEKDAKQVSTHRMQKQRTAELAKTNRLSLENLFEQMQEGEIQDLNLILKADVHGSNEALKESLEKLSNEEVKINIVHSATGAITESDIFLAAGSNAIIIGFNVRPNAKVQSMAQEENVDMRYYNVIYDVIQDVKNAIVGMMASTFNDVVLGRADVRQIFHVPKVGTIAGCQVADGKITRNNKARLVRDGVVIYDGRVTSLRRYKDDVKEVASGFECGIALENYNDLKEGDVIECYLLEEIRPDID